MVSTIGMEESPMPGWRIDVPEADNDFFLYTLQTMTGHLQLHVLDSLAS